MKITPIASGTGEPGQVTGNVEIGSSAGKDRKAAAKRAFRGESGVTMTEKEMPGRVPELKKRTLTMKTNATPENYVSPEEAQLAQETESTPTSQNAIPTPNEETPAEETKPLSPQFAALARQKRALQVKESELAKREEALRNSAPQASSGVDTARIKADPLGVLREAGVSYDDLTQAIMQNPQASGPNPELNELKETILGLEKRLEDKFSERDTQAEQQVLNEIGREARFIAKDNPEFEVLAATNSFDDVKELIHRNWKNTGEVMDTTEAMRLIEDDLIEQLDPLTKLKKIQGRSAPNLELQQQPPQERQMRTLTNRDGSSPGLSRRDRAMAAFNGQLKRG